MTRTIREACLCLPVLLLYAALPGAGALHAQAQACEWDWVGAQPASLGIGRLLCIGGACEINVEAEGGRVHRFATEPRVTELRDPATGVLEDRDVLVAIDGVPITTREGGSRLARASVGTPVRLTIRRRGETKTVRLVPVPGCPIGALSVRMRDDPRRR